MIKNRNEVLDIVRGIAIIMVILGHVISNNVKGFENSLVFNLIWSLQMPLFMIISGYLTRYSKQLITINDFFNYILKKSFAYLFPWLIWTFIIRVLLVKPDSFNEYIVNILYHMDTGYWFLFSLWTICIIYTISSFLARKISKNALNQITINICITIGIMFILLFIGIQRGVSFLGIKYTLYYSCFYYVGYLYTQIQQRLNRDRFENLKDIFIFFSILIYSLILIKQNLYAESEGIRSIVIRFIASFLGCAIVFYTVSSRINMFRGKLGKIFLYAGRYSLELYLVHTLFLSGIPINLRVDIYSSQAYLICGLKFITTIVCSFLFISIIHTNKWSRFVFFGKGYKV